MSHFTRTKLATLPALVPITLALFTSLPARAGSISPDPVVVYTYTVVNTPLPNWGLGNPQPAEVGVCTWVRAGNCGGLENEAGIALLTAPATFGAFTINGDTFAQEAANIIGADVRVPTAYWLSPAVYYWTGGVAGGGAVAFFNSLVGGVYYANELVVLDPPSIDPIDALNLFAPELGSLDILPPGTDIEPSSDTGAVNIPNPQTGEAPEPASIVLMALGVGALWRRRDKA